MRSIWIIPLVCALASCGAPSSTGDNAEPAKASTPRIVSAQSIEAPLPVYRMVVEPGAPGLTEKARELCGSASHCSVYAWSDATLAGRGFPFTDRERAGVVFQYDVNRSTGFERSLFDCQAFPQPDTNQCLSQ